MNAIQLQQLKQLVPNRFIDVDHDNFAHYSHDETEDLKFYPDLVLMPESTHEVSQILAYCHQNNIPVTTRGAGTGLSGGALPIHAGVVLSTEKMNRIITIDQANLQIVTQPGVITQVLQETVIEKGLFYPVDPSSRGSSFIGGNVAHNSGGPRAVKYGVTKDYVLDLEVVLADGKIMHTGAKVLKNSTGYNLTQLFVGSEGTLGVITEITLKLLPFPEKNMVMLAPFQSAEKACEAVSAIFRAGITPSALEFMERDAIDWTLHYKPELELTIADDVKAHLLIEVDGNDEAYIMQQCEAIAAVLEQFESGEILLADNEKQKADLWRLRRSVAEAVKSNSVYKEEDTVVPRASLPNLLQGVKTIGAKYGFKSVCYGHAGDGNLHVNIIKGDLSNDAWQRDITIGIREIFSLVKSLGGTLSGEHGIGYVQKPYMDIMFPEFQLDLMRQIKLVFDPKGILNPGKIF